MIAHFVHLFRFAVLMAALGALAACMATPAPGRLALPDLPGSWVSGDKIAVDPDKSDDDNAARKETAPEKGDESGETVGEMPANPADAGGQADIGTPGDRGASLDGKPGAGGTALTGPQTPVPATTPPDPQLDWQLDPQLDWRSAFEDPILNSLIDKALTHNNDIAIAAARVKASQAALRQTRAGLLPNLSVDVSRQRRADLPPGFAGAATGSAAGSASDARVFSTGYRAAGQLDWEIDLWGRLSAQTRAAYLDRDAARTDLAAARLSIALNLANLWYRVVEGAQQIDLAHRDVETGNANLSIIARRYKGGLSSSLDVRLAKASLENSKSQLAFRKQTQQELIRAIEILLGQYPAARLADTGDLPVLSGIETGVDPALVMGTPAQLLDRRPDILGAEFRLKAAGLRVAAARRALIPAIRLSGVLTNTSSSSRDLFSVDAVTGMLTASLIQPVFQGGRLRANIAQQKALQEIALREYVRTTLNAFQEVEDALAADDFLAQQEQALAASFEESVAAERITNRQYRRGTTTIFNLINAQQRRIQTESQLLSVRQQRIANRLTLFAALGIDPAHAGGSARLSRSGRVLKAPQGAGIRLSEIQRSETRRPETRRPEIRRSGTMSFLPANAAAGDGATALGGIGNSKRGL